MSYGYDEFESKLGQFIYTMVMYERLKEYLIDKVRGRGRVSVRINLGQDKNGNHIFMDVILTSIKPEAYGPIQQAVKQKTRKNLVIILSNEEVSGDNKQIADEMEKLIMESLRWWHSYFGERDRLKLNEWKIERITLVDAEATEVLCEIPADRIVVPPERRMSLSPETLENLAQYIDLLGPITVRPTDTGYYELITGYPQLYIYVDKLGRDRVFARVLEVGEEEAKLIHEDTQPRIKKLIEQITEKIPRA